MEKSIVFNWKLLGAELANLTDEEQGDFFQGFINEMLSWDTHYQREMQCTNIQDKLTKLQRSYIATIGWDGEEN